MKTQQKQKFEKMSRFRELMRCRGYLTGEELTEISNHTVEIFTNPSVWYNVNEFTRELAKERDLETK